MTDPLELRATFVEWIYDQAGGSAAQIVDAQPFLHDADIDLADGLYLVRNCAAAGLLLDRNSMGAARAQLTPAGVEAVLTRRQRRSDPVERHKAARNQLLRWLDQQDREGVVGMMVSFEGFMTHELSTFSGTVFTNAEVERTALWLCREKLIEGTFVAEQHGPVAARITFEGQEVIERFGGDVEKWREHKESGARTQVTNNFGNVTATNVAIGSSNVSMNVTNSADLAAVGSLVTVMLRELSALQLSAELETGARSALVEAQQELSLPDPDRGKVAAAIAKFSQFVARAGEQALAAAFVIAAQAQGMLPAPGQ